MCSNRAILRVNADSDAFAITHASLFHYIRLLQRSRADNRPMNAECQHCFHLLQRSDATAELDRDIQNGDNLADDMQVRRLSLKRTV